MPVHLERPAEHPHTALVTIARPQQANCLNPEMINALSAAWREIAADNNLRCAVLTGAGARVFCSGMDMKSTIAVAQQLARGEQIPARDFEALRNVKTSLLAGFDLQKPLIAAVNGHARAGGFDLMLAAELRYAAPHATFALEEVARGLYPTGNSTVLLPRQIGWALAHELLLTAKPITAQRALAAGLINEIVPAGELLQRALEAADAIAQNAPLAVRETRRGVREVIALPLPRAYEVQEQIGAALRGTEDAREAQRAFVEKRAPRWQGR